MRFFSKILSMALLANLISSTYAWAQEYTKYNMPRGVTPLSRDIYDLHMIIFAICVVISIIVFGFLFYSLIMHRKARGVVPATFHEHPVIEVLWAIVPLLILIVMAIPATIVTIRMYDASDASLTVKVTAYQWKWKYDYLDQGISFFSNLSTPLDQINNRVTKNPWYLLEVDKPLVVPIHEKIRFLVTANDVIHSWWVPAFGIKRDAIPGFIHEAWAWIEKPGVYRGQCAELCGMYHGYMPIVVIAKTQEDYNKWLQEQQTMQIQEKTQTMKKMTFNELITFGKSAYNKSCVACHQENGMGIPKVFPALKASSMVIGKPIARHIATILNGIPGTAMQAFSNQLTDLEIAAIVTYERNAWENNTGDIVQASDVQAERGKSTHQSVANPPSPPEPSSPTLKPKE